MSEATNPDLTEGGKKPWFRRERRAAPFAPDKEKFSTQRAVTYTLLVIFTGVSGWVMYGDDQSERSMVLQTIINLTLLAVGYWLGASKSGSDQAQSMSRMAESAAPTAAAAVAAAKGQPSLNPVPAPTSTKNMSVTAEKVDVTEQPAEAASLCPKCQAPQEPGVKFCNKCGEPQKDGLVKPKEPDK